MIITGNKHIYTHITLYNNLYSYNETEIIGKMYIPEKNIEL